MVDSALYTNVGGAKEFLRKTHLLSNNLANINTVGFHADFGTMVSNKVNAAGMQSRTIPTLGETYTNHKSGPVSYTGRELDVAIDGEGFFAVQNKAGQEGLTRAGNFDITSQGLLVTQNGDLILGEDGVIDIPPASQVTISQNGTVTARLKGEPESTVAEIGRIKLVKPSVTDIEKGEDGLYYPKAGADIASSREVALVPESLEGSNVDPVSALIELVDTSRQFDFQTKLMHTIEENATKANSLLDLQR